MKKLLIVLISIITLQVQGQSVFTVGDTTHCPRVGSNGTIYRQAAYSVVKPPDYTTTKTYPVVMLIHGVGERGKDDIDALRNVLMGFDYDGPTGPLPRQYAFVMPDFYTAIKTKQFLGVAVTYANEFNPTDVNFVLDDIERNWSVDKNREAIIGFSLGGGAVVRYVSSSLVNAKRLCLAVAIAPVNWLQYPQHIVDAKLPFVGVTNRTDPRVSPSNIIGIIDKINALNPTVAPKLMIFPQDGHGGIHEIQALLHPYVPQSVYDYILTADKANPKAYPLTGTTSPTQPVPSDPLPVTDVQAVAKEIGITTSSSISLDGSGSKGFTGASWGVLSVPAGVSIYTNLFPKGAGWHTVTAALPREGAYTFVLNAYNSTQTSRDTIVVTYQKASIPVPPVPLTYDSETGYLVFSDGSRIKATATVNFGTKKVTIKGEDGITYTL